MALRDARFASGGKDRQRLFEGMFQSERSMHAQLCTARWQNPANNSAGGTAVWLTDSLIFVKYVQRRRARSAFLWMVSGISHAVSETGVKRQSPPHSRVGGIGSQILKTPDLYYNTLLHPWYSIKLPAWQHLGGARLSRLAVAQAAGALGGANLHLE